MRQTRARSLGLENPLEKEMATHSSILAWKIPWTEKPGGLQVHGVKELDMTEQLKLHFGASQVALVVKNSFFNVRDIRDVGSIPVLGIPWRRL